MEPFRPIIDFHLAHFVQSQDPFTEDVRPFKQTMQEALEKKYPYGRQNLDFPALVEATCRSLRKAVLTANPNVFRPWTAKNSKWAG